jgi:hypothetical protein
MKEGKRKALVHDNEKSFILLVSFNRLSLISLLYIIISRKKLSTIKEKKRKSVVHDNEEDAKLKSCEN